MAPRDAQVSTDEAIANLKSLLTTLTDANEGITSEIGEIRDGDAAREQFIDEIDHQIESLTRNVNDYRDKIELDMNAIEVEQHEDFKTGFFERIQELTEDFYEEVEGTVAKVNDTHASLQSAHEHFISEHHDYMQVELESVDVAGTMMSDVDEAYESMHGALEHAKEQGETDAGETRGIFADAVDSIGDHSVDATSNVFDALADAVNAALMTSSQEAWMNLKDQCESCTSEFRQWVDNLAEDTDNQGREALEDFSKHMEQELKSPLEQLFDKAREDGASSVMDEIAELLGVMETSTVTAAALGPLLPMLCVVEAVVEAFEKVLEALSPGE